jgi:hypothetical protein
MAGYIEQTKQPVAHKLGLNLRTEHRTVEVTMTYRGIEEATFAVENPAVLNKILRHYEELPVKEEITYKFTGVKEEALPLGLARTRMTAELANRADAMRYLKRGIDLAAA